jgi:Arc/MetJ-type ribon-helix-helix transcriptional regulator
MPRKDYRSLTIPKGLYLELEKFVEQSNGSYVSISEVVREALRAYLRKQHDE